MKDFEYMRPETIEKAVALYREGGPAAKLLAGGTELINEMRLGKTRPDLVIHATSSFFHEVYPQICACIQAQADVISTCEELVYPYARDPVPAAEMDVLREFNPGGCCHTQGASICNE